MRFFKLINLLFIVLLLTVSIAFLDLLSDTLKMFFSFFGELPLVLDDFFLTQSQISNKSRKDVVRASHVLRLLPKYAYRCFKFLRL